MDSVGGKQLNGIRILYADSLASVTASGGGGKVSVLKIMVL